MKKYRKKKMEAPVKQIYQILKEYIPAKDIQQATDHLVDDLQEILDEEDLIKLAGIDKYMKNSVTEVLGDYEEDEDEDYADMY